MSFAKLKVKKREIFFLAFLLFLFILSCSTKNDKTGNSTEIERKSLIRINPKSVDCAPFDNTYKVPACPKDVESCMSCSTDGNDNSSTNPEKNQPNTLYNSCPDKAGTVYWDINNPSNTYIRVKYIEINSLSQTGFIEPGSNIKVTVETFCNNYNQYIDVFFADDADSPSWQYIGSCQCGKTGSFVNVGSFAGLITSTCIWYSTAYQETVNFILTIPSSIVPPKKVALRARIQNSNSYQTSPCYTSSSVYDHDDIVFTVQNPPSDFSCAVYNSYFSAPICYGRWCGTCNLSPCRGNVSDSAESPPGFYQCSSGGNEPYQPNSVFSQCQDTSENDSGLLDEQIRRINIKPLGGDFRGGQNAEVSILSACNSNNNSQIVIAYASGVTFSPYQSANWRYVGTILCNAGSKRDWMNFNYIIQLDNVEGWHAIRVVEFRCPGCSAVQNNICPNYSYRDADDFIFYVKASPSSELSVCASYDNSSSDGDPAYNAPKCPAGASYCSTCKLTVKRQSTEPNSPNAIFSSCSDQGGTSDEAIERIDIKSYSSDNSFQPGTTAEVRVLVNCSTTFPWYLIDNLAVFYTDNADSPSWVRVLTGVCSAPGFQLFKTTIKLSANSGRHSIRAMIQQGGISDSATCATGSNADTDDLIFFVGVPKAPSDFKANGYSPNSITLVWSDVQDETFYELRYIDSYSTDPSTWATLANLPANSTWYLDGTLAVGAYRCYALRACNPNGCSAFVRDCSYTSSPGVNCASYDSVWKVPACPVGVNNCSTCELVRSRDTIAPRSELNTPNSWFSSNCLDGNSGSYWGSRSIEKITLSTSATTFSSGYQVNVTVDVFCSSTNDYVHLYYSAGTEPVSFIKVGSQACSGSGRVESKTFSFTPSSGGLLYILRAVITGSVATTCPSGPQDEVDDIAFRVSGSPPMPADFNVVFVSPDIARVWWSDVIGEDYYSLVSSPTLSGTFSEDTPHSPFPSGTTLHEHQGMNSGDVLCFKVSACNSEGCSSYTTAKCAVRPPLPPYSLSTTSYSTESMGNSAKYVLRFIDNSGNEDGFAIDRTSDGLNWTRYFWNVDSSISSGTGERVTELTLSADVRWCFRVASFKTNPSTGEKVLSSWADNSTRCVVGLKAPSQLQVEPLPAVRKLSFFWLDNSSYELGFGFEWRPQPILSYISDTLPANSSFLEKVFPDEQTYCFRITSWWSELSSWSISFSSEKCAVSLGSPSPLYVYQIGSKIKLEWQDNMTTSAGTSYRVYWRDSGGGWTALANTSPDSTTYVFQPPSSRKYCFFVSTIFGTVVGASSNVSCINYNSSACSLSAKVSGFPSGISGLLSDGEVVFVSYSGGISSISKFNGSKVWGLSLGSSSISSNICNLSPGRIFFGTYDGKVYIVGKSGATILKSKVLGLGTVEGCAVSDDGNIYITTTKGNVVALNQSLDVINSVNIGSQIHTAPAIDERNNYLYVVADDGKFRVFDLSLNLKTSLNVTTSPIRSSPAVGPKGEIYFGADDGKLYKIKSGDWSIYSTTIGVDPIITSPVVYSWGAGVTVFAASGSVLTAVDGEKMVQKWNLSFASQINGSPVISRNSVFIAAGNQVGAVKISDGLLLCSYYADGGIISPLEIDRYDIVFGDVLGNLYIIQSDSSEPPSWWDSFSLDGRRSVGGIYTPKGFAYEEAKYCPTGGGTGFLYSLIATDIISDAGYEIFAGYAMGTNKGKVYLLRSDGKEIWSSNIGEDIWSVPAVGDVDGDRTKDIVIGTDSGKVWVFRASGVLLGTQTLCGRIRAITLVNLDLDPAQEIIAVAQVCSRVYVLDWSGGSLVISKQFDLSSDSNNNSYAIHNSGKIYVTGLSGGLYIFDYVLETTTRVSINTSGLDTPAIGDVNGDGVKEIVFGGRDSKLYIRDLNGGAVAEVDLSGYIGSSKCIKGPALADLDGSNGDEIYVMTTDCSNIGSSALVKVKYNSGSYSVEWTRPFSKVASSVPAIADFDGDGVGEIGVITDDGYLRVYESDGSESFVGLYFFTSGAYGGRGGISVGDIEGDGRMNLVFGDMDGLCVRVFEFGEGTGSGQIWWGHYRLNEKQNAVK